jgi:anti-sigma factor (TIGR02949 family)
MTCQDLIEVLDDYLDGTLPADRRGDLERHLEECAPCRAYLATYRKTRELGAAAARVEVPEEMKARLRRFLDDQFRRS